jgi:hypothetical protein
MATSAPTLTGTSRSLANFRGNPRKLCQPIILLLRLEPQTRKGKQVLYKFVTFFALLVASCATIQPGTDGSSESGSPGEVRASILIAPGVDISQITYTIACTPTPAPSQVATGTWPVTGVYSTAKVNGSIGGLDPNSTCTVVLSAQDTWGLEHGNIQNCRGEADGVQPNGGVLQMNLTCTDNNVVGTNAGNITADITVRQGSPYQCSGISWYSSAESTSTVPGAGSAFTLNMGVTVPTSPQTVTWTSSDGVAVWYQNGAVSANSFNLTGNPATDPPTSGNSVQAMYCYASGFFTITLTVQDLTTGLLINGQPSLCPAYSNTFPIICY